MQIIIDIPKDRYKEIVSGIFDADGYFKTNLTLAFRNGTPLPKGHGRLIDADELSKKPWFDVDLNENDAPTVLEADRGCAEDGRTEN